MSVISRSTPFDVAAWKMSGVKVSGKRNLRATSLASGPKLASRIPDWYRKAVPAHSFVLFPLNIKGNPVALIYADRDEPGGIEIPEKELQLLRTLRNQAIMAIKQGG
jgi:hypothetical protein